MHESLWHGWRRCLGEWGAFMRQRCPGITQRGGGSWLESSEGGRCGAWAGSHRTRERSPLLPACSSLPSWAPPPPYRHHPTAWRHLEQANGLQRSSLQRHPAEADEALLKVCLALPLLPLHCPWEYISAHTAAWPSTRCFVCVCPWWPRLPLPPPLPGGQTQCLCVHLHALLLPTCAR